MSVCWHTDTSSNSTPLNQARNRHLSLQASNLWRPVLGNSPVACKTKPGTAPIRHLNEDLKHVQGMGISLQLCHSSDKVNLLTCNYWNSCAMPGPLLVLMYSSNSTKSSLQNSKSCQTVAEGVTRPFKQILTEHGFVQGLAQILTGPLVSFYHNTEKKPFLIWCRNRSR